MNQTVKWTGAVTLLLCACTMGCSGCGTSKPIPSNPPPPPVPRGALGGGLKPGEVVKNSIGMEFVVIESGEFEMGATARDETSDFAPPHPVVIQTPFLFGKFEVTQDEFQRVMEMNPSFFSATGGGDYKIPSQKTGRFPVDSVSWDDAVEFCKRLSELPEEKSRGVTYRLPSEAEWEYACRAGTKSAYPWGDDLTPEQANVNFSAAAESGAFLDRTAEVGSGAANAWGLHDMIGNVNEWCGDWYDGQQYSKSGAAASEPPKEGLFRVLRGGCWFVSPAYSKSFSRDNRSPAARDQYNGFRVIAIDPRVAAP